MRILLLKLAPPLKASVCKVTLSEAEMDIISFRTGILCEYGKKKNDALSNLMKLQETLYSLLSILAGYQMLFVCVCVFPLNRFC